MRTFVRTPGGELVVTFANPSPTAARQEQLVILEVLGEVIIEMTYAEWRETVDHVERKKASAEASSDWLEEDGA